MSGLKQPEPSAEQAAQSAQLGSDTNDDAKSESDWKPKGSGAMGVVMRMLEGGANPNEICDMLGLEAPGDYSPIQVLRKLLGCLQQSTKRERQNKYDVDGIVKLIKDANNIMILTGAGISVSCGIPDFRSKDGLYAKLSKDFPELPDPQSMFCLDFFKKDQRPFFRFAKEIYPGSFTPSPSHRFIAELEKRGKLLRNFTQNIDGLEQEAGIKNVIQCHGHFHTASCMTCKEKYSSEEIKGDIFAQRIPRCRKLRQKKRMKTFVESEVPTCPTEEDIFESYVAECEAVIKPDIVFFGESLPKHFHNAMVNEKDKADLLIVMGSSLKVGPVNEIPDALEKAVPAILMNRESLRYASEFDGELLGNCDDIVRCLANKLGWTDFEGQTETNETTMDKLEEIAEKRLQDMKDEAPPEKKQKIEEGPSVSDMSNLWKSRWKPKIEVPKEAFCKLESGYQTIFHGHELGMEEADSDSSSDESDIEQETETNQTSIEAPSSDILKLEEPESSTLLEDKQLQSTDKTSEEATSHQSLTTQKS